MKFYNNFDFAANLKMDKPARYWYCFAEDVKTVHDDLSKGSRPFWTSLGAEPDIIVAFNFPYEERKKDPADEEQGAADGSA
jgi:hypothetical protein